MSDSIPQDTQQGSHGEALLPQAAKWDAGNDGAGGFLGPSSFFTPAGYATQALAPTDFDAAALTCHIDMVAVSAGPISSAPNLSGHHQLQPQDYFAVVDSNNDNNNGIDAYPYYQDQHAGGGGGGGSFAAGNAMANVPVVQDYGQDAWMGGMNSGSIDAAVALGACVMPVQSSSSPSSQSFQPMAMSQYHGPATADGLPYEPSPLSTPRSHMMQSPWRPQWDRVQGPAIVDALGDGPSASSPSTPAVAALSPVAQHASNEHGTPAHHRVSPGGGDRRGSCCIAPGPSGHPSTALEYQRHQAYGYPGGHLAAAAACDAMGAYAPDSHAMGDVAQSPAMGLAQGSGSVVSPGCSAQQNHVASIHGPVAPPQAAGGHHYHHHEATPSSSSPTAGIELDYPTGTDLKKEDQRRRNRMAASKCRARAKEGEIRLQSNAWVVSGGWTDLAAMARKLTVQVRVLRKEVQRHAHCGHPLIQEYLRHMEPLAESDDEEDGAGAGVIARQATL